MQVHESYGAGKSLGVSVELVYFPKDIDRSNYNQVCRHGVICAHIFLSLVYTDDLETVQVQQQWPHLVFLSQCLNPIFQEKEPGIAGGMADSKIVIGEIEDEPVAHCSSRKRKGTGPHWRDTEAKWKALPVAKPGVIWVTM